MQSFQATFPLFQDRVIFLPGLYLLELLPEGRNKEGLHQDPGLCCLCLCLRLIWNIRVMGDQEQDRYGIRYCFPYLLGHLSAAHPLFTPVCQHQLVTACLCVTLYVVHRLLYSGSQIHLDAHIQHHFLDIFTGLPVAANHKHAGDTTCFPEFPVYLAFWDPQFQFHLEETTLVNLTSHINGSTHQFHDALGNGHTQPCTLYLVGGTILRPGKCIKDNLQVLLCHSISVVFHFNPDTFILCRALFHSCHAQPDITPSRGILYRIGEQVDQNLADPGLIPQKIFMSDPRHFHMELLALGRRHGTDNGIHGRHQVIQGKFLYREYHFPALNLGHIQHIIDQAKQMLSRSLDLLRVFPHLVRAVRIPGQQGCKSQHGIHGCADIMGHIGQKGSLGIAGNLCCLQGLCQLLIVKFPLCLPFFPYLLLLSLAEIIQDTAQKKGRKHHHYHNQYILVDRLPLLLDRLNGYITGQVKASPVHGPHIVQGFLPTNVMVEQDIPSILHAVQHFFLQFLVPDIIGPVKILQVQVSRISLPHALRIQHKALTLCIHNIEHGLLVVETVREGFVQGVIHILHIERTDLLPVLLHGTLHGIGPGAHIVDI